MNPRQLSQPMYCIPDQWGEMSGRNVLGRNVWQICPDIAFTHNA